MSDDWVPVPVRPLDKIASEKSAIPISKRQIFSKTSFCTILYFHYKKQNFGVMSNIRASLESTAFQVEKGVIQEEIASVSVSKNISAPSGSFEIRLHPTRNWKSVLSPGDWICIYFHNRLDKDAENFAANPSTKNLVMLGNVDRIARALEKDEETDKAKLQYVVSGRNFGKAFEDTEIWYDPYAIQVEGLDVALRFAGLELIGSPSEQVKQIYDVFMGPGGQFKDGRTKPLMQWRIPKELAQLFKTKSSVVSGKPLIYDIVDNKIKTGLPGFKPRNMLTAESNGSVWDMMTRSCNGMVNEMFLEEVRSPDGTVKPTIVLRPRPLQTPFFEATSAKYSQFGSEDAKLRARLKSAYQTMQKLSRDRYVEVHPTEIRYENIGRDDHSRINMMMLKTTLEYEFMLTTVSDLNKKNGIANPVFVRESIQRHGLKRFEQVLEYCFAEGQNQGSESQAAGRNVDLFKAFMVQLYDLHFANHLYEAGTIECSGILEAELGKCLVIPPDKDSKAPPKIYYIEGYDHSWKFPSEWKTTFTVTHGQFQTNDSKIFIDVTSDPTDNGQADTALNTTYLAKTLTRKK